MVHYEKGQRREHNIGCGAVGVVDLARMVALPCRVFILGGTRTPSIWPGHRYFPRRQGRWSADDQGQCACFLHLSSFDLVRATVHSLGSAITLVSATPMRFPYSLMCAAILGLFVVAHAISIHGVKLPSTQASTSAPSSTTRRSVPATTPPRPVSSSSPSPPPAGWARHQIRVTRSASTPSAVPSSI